MGKRIAISEYGAGGDFTQHTEGMPIMPKPAHGGPFQPEEWLAYVHERDWRIMKNNPCLWGTFLWSMFDFASCMRNAGSVPSVNTKGIVSLDRKIKKDPFFFYKANWNSEPMVYITSKRSDKRKISVTDVKIYSNCENVTLFVNGRKVGTTTPDDTCVAVFKEIKLRRGNNKVEVVGLSKHHKVKDKCVWNYE